MNIDMIYVGTHETFQNTLSNDIRKSEKIRLVLILKTRAILK